MADSRTVQGSTSWTGFLFDYAAMALASVAKSG